METEFEKDILEAYGLSNDEMNRARNVAVETYHATTRKSDCIVEMAKKYNISVEAAVSCAFIGVLY